MYAHPSSKKIAYCHVISNPNFFCTSKIMLICHLKPKNKLVTNNNQMYVHPGWNHNHYVIN